MSYYLNMIKYLLFFTLFICPPAVALDDNRPIKHKIGTEVQVKSDSDNKISIYYELEKEADDYKLSVKTKLSHQNKEQIYKIKVEVEF